MTSDDRKSAIIQLFLVSLVSLFCEMMVIRWLSTEIRAFSYFKNLPLMAAFLGLGVGFLSVDKKADLLRWSSILMLYFCGLMIVSIGLGLTHLNFVDSSKVVMFGSFLRESNFAFSILILILVFILTAAIFVGLGQRTGILFGKLRPLEAYSYNVGGALCGILLFAALSNFSLGPGLWMLVCGVLFLLLQRSVVPFALMALGIVYMTFLAPYCAKQLFGPDHIKTVWSPYYRIDLVRSRLPASEKSVPIGYDIYINYDSFQSMLDTRSETLEKVSEPVRKMMLGFFTRPFELLPKQNINALILGAGTGSDVAAALRCGCAHVDAVEIDPSIYQLGKQLHPLRPYDSDKVQTYVMDARTFLSRNTNKKYDVIIYAVLDSHTAFSSLSSLRTDNYIFTVESFRQAYKLLKPDGALAVSFICIPDWLWSRQCKDLALGTGQQPRGYFWVTSLPTGFIVAGPQINAGTKLNCPMPPRALELKPEIPEITDDWPFLFLPSRGIPSSYFLPLFSVLLCSIWPVRNLMRTGGKNLLNWQMFCLGMGFMLLEVRAMSSMSLLFGSTWTVNSFVISGVMVAILVANYLASKASEKGVFVFLFLSLFAIVASNLAQVGELLKMPENVGAIVGTLAFVSPLFFAGGVFSTLFKQTQSSSQALAFNMVGGLLGITIEYFGMCFGISKLSYFALAIYALVLILQVCRMKQTPAAEPLVASDESSV